MCAFTFAEIIIVSRTVRESPAKGFPEKDGILYQHVSRSQIRYTHAGTEQV
jgi:hypothetical protein